MQGFTSSMSAEEFVRELARRRSTWRKQAGDVRSRRWLRGLARSRISWFKKHSGHSALPTLPADAEPNWLEPSVEQLKIVFVSPSDAREGLRKALKRDLWHVAGGTDGLRIELLRQRRRRAGGGPLVGFRRRRRGGREVRALFLDAVGAAIVGGLDTDEIKRLEDAGATVLDNEFVPVPEDAQPSPEVVVVGSLPWHLSHIGIETARAKGLDGRGVLVGIADSGVDEDHPEFVGKRIYFQSFLPNGEPDRRPCVMDYGWHGTHVAALCAGASHGVAPGADLAVAAVATSRRNGRLYGALSQILGGMNWLADGGVGLPRPVDVLNASLGGKNTRRHYSSVSRYTKRGVLVVAAIGNNGLKGAGNHSAPGMFDCVVGVGAVDRSDRMADFSDWGTASKEDGSAGDPKPEICAPGVAVVSAIPGKGFRASDGTSMATPMVSGAAALLINHDERLRRQPKAITDKLLTLARNLPSAPDFGRCGRGTLDLRNL